MEKRKIKTKTVGIGDKHSTRQDEVCCEWFTCPKCNENLIMGDFSYCPGCGRKIRWKNTKND